MFGDAGLFIVCLQAFFKAHFNLSAEISSFNQTQRGIIAHKRLHH
jgi:hypothetical protein